MTRTKILTLAMAIPLAATLAVAGGGERGPRGHGGPGMGGGWRGGGMFLEKQLERVGLSAEQKTKIDAILAKARKSGEGDVGKLQSESNKLHEMLEQEKPEEKAILEQVDRVGKLRIESQKSMIRTLLAVRAELTPEQRTKLKELGQDRMQQRKEHRQNRRGGGGKPPPPPAAAE